MIQGVKQCLNFPSLEKVFPPMESKMPLGFSDVLMGLSLSCVQKPAFSKDDLLPMDLGTFYREFQNPPQLASLSIDVSAQSMAEDLVRILCSVLLTAVSTLNPVNAHNSFLFICFFSFISGFTSREAGNI